MPDIILCHTKICSLSHC